MLAVPFSQSAFERLEKKMEKYPTEKKKTKDKSANTNEREVQTQPQRYLLVIQLCP